MSAELAEKYLDEPVILKHLVTKAEEGGIPVPDLNTAHKLQTWGCPACQTHGCFHHVPEKDEVVCEACGTHFSGEWLAKWGGDYYPKMKGTKPSHTVVFGVKHAPWGNLDDEDDYDPIMETLGAKLLKLQEKVVKFREAVVNPDRVTNDEEIETLLKELFEVSYTLPTPSDDDEAEEYLEPLYDLDPSHYDSLESFFEQVRLAAIDGTITYAQADALILGFGGDDPFPAKILKEGEIDPDIVPKAIVTPTPVATITLTPDQIDKFHELLGSGAVSFADAEEFLKGKEIVILDQHYQPTEHEDGTIENLNFETAEIESDPYFEGDGPIF